MVYFIDFEATQFTQEILSIGIVREDGACFRSFVRPPKGGARVTKFITQLTGITPEQIETAPSIDEVAELLNNWLEFDENDVFYTYGTDQVYIDATLKRDHGERAHLVLQHIRRHMKDYSKQVRQFFGISSISLKKIFSYIKGEEIVQKHDALEDAAMLMEVFIAFPTLEKPEECPFPEHKILPKTRKEGTPPKPNPNPNYIPPTHVITKPIKGVNVNNPKKVLYFNNIFQLEIAFATPHTGYSKSATARRRKAIRKAIAENGIWRDYQWTEIDD